MDAENHDNKLHDSAVVIDGDSYNLIPDVEGKIRMGFRVKVPDPATWRPSSDLEQSLLAKLAVMSELCA